MRLLLGSLSAVVCMYACIAISSVVDAQVLLSDDFERKSGSFGQDGPPPVPSLTDWGSFNNALGGTVTPTSYLITQAANNNIQSVGLDDSGDYDDNGSINSLDFLKWQRDLGVIPTNPGEGADGNFSGTVDGGDLPVWSRNYGGPFGKGELRFGRTFLDVNLAGLSAVQSSGGFAIQADIAPSDTGNPGGNGRDWAGIMIADTTDPNVITSSFALANASNDNVRFGAAPRNSGSLLYRVNNEAPGVNGGGDQVFATGNPFNAGINEPIIDNPVFNDYSINYQGPNSPSPPDDFVNPTSYTVNVDVDVPNGFGAGETAFATVTIGGNTIYTNEPFTWGSDPGDADNVYLGFVGFGTAHEFDNLQVSSNGTTLFSDDFNGRTTGLAAEPIGGGNSSWGSPNNNLGGSVVTSYLTTNAGSADQQTVESGQGLLRDGRTIVDYNLATDATILANQEFSIEFEVDPADEGTIGTADGRAWGGFALGNTNDLVNWGGSLFLPNNGNARLGFAPRNSGTVLSVARGGFGTLTDGNPSNPFNEIIFDSDVFNDYSANYNPATNLPYINEKEYTIRIEVASDFSANSASTATIYIGEVGGSLVNQGTFDFQWGDNAGEAYIVFGANQALHKIDNFIIEALPASVGAVPEPSSVAMIGACLLCVARRRTRSGKA